jgi:hypothetical protein
VKIIVFILCWLVAFQVMLDVFIVHELIHGEVAWRILMHRPTG